MQDQIIRWLSHEGRRLKYHTTWYAYCTHSEMWHHGMRH